MPSGGSPVRVDRVVAVVATLRDGREQLGSGYLVGGRLVLTAEHCTRDKVTGEPASRLRVVRASDGVVAQVADVVADRGLDVAVLRLADDAPWDAGLPPPAFARVDQSQSGALDDCTGIGFPLFQRDPDRRTRHTSEFHGTIYQTDERESGRLLVREPLIRPGPATGPAAGAAPGEPGEQGPSPWGGLSGALMFYRGRAIGVVVEHHPRQGDSALVAVGFERIAAASAEIRQCLALPGPDNLPLVSDQAQPAGVAVGHADHVTVARPRVVSQPVRLAPRPGFLAGREELLADLDALLSGGNGDGPRIAVLCGLGGAGKTSVAVEYAHRHLHEVGVAWQFAAEDPAVLATEFADLAAELGARELADARNPVASVHAVLAKQTASWLLVFDNVPDRASVLGFLPPAGRGLVLITCRNPAWPPGQLLEVPVLAIEVAADFLEKRTGDPDRVSAVELAGQLGGLPLALEQAAAYLQVTGTRLADYLALFGRRRSGLLARGEPVGYSGTVATAWRLAFDRLEQSEPQAAGLLRLLAFCAPEQIPLRVLLQPRPGLARRLGASVAPALEPLLDDPLAANDAVAALRRYSLITPAGDGSVSVHRLVQAVTADQMPPNLADQWRLAAAALIEAAIPDDTASPQSWPVCAALLPHVQATLADDSFGMAQLADYLGWAGRYGPALELLRRVIAAQEQSLGAEHPHTLSSRQSLAQWTGDAGDSEAARDQLAALLPLRERVLGAEHPDTLATRYSLAWRTAASDPAAARDQLATLLPVRERVLGAEHPDTLNARRALARMTGEAGNPAAARDQLAVLLPVIERVLGTEHRDSLRARGTLAQMTGQTGDPAAARDQLAALLPVRERVLGAEHPETLGARETLARMTGEAGDPAAARDQLAALLPVRERVLGPESPLTLDTLYDLADWTGVAGDPAAARDQLAALLPVRERVLGAEHPVTMWTRYALADWTGVAGDPAAARDQLAALLPVRERVLGAEHPDTVATRYALARWTGEEGDPAAARDQLAALLPICQRVFGAEHPNTWMTGASLAGWTGVGGDPAAARDQLAALLAVCRRVFGAEHPNTLTTRDALAYWTSKADQEPSSID